MHTLYDLGGAAVANIEAAFPGTCLSGVVDRKRLGAAVLNDPGALNRLEKIVHPLLAEGRKLFVERARAAGAAAAVLDIPLLFETGGEGAVDAVVVVSAPEDIQRARVLARPGMTDAKFHAIKSRQMPDAEKRRRADFVVETGRGLEVAREQVNQVLAIVTDPKFQARARPRDALDEAAEPPH